MTPTEKIQRIKELGQQLRELWPSGTLSVTVGYSSCEVDLSAHNVGEYHDCTEFLRSFGVGVRKKQVFETDHQWHSLSGTLDGVSITAYGNGLPPSCRIETVIEKIPKTNTVDTGEFIEVERRKVICGKETA